MIRNMLLTLTLSLSSLGYSATLEEADQLFQERETKAAEARAAYLSLAPSLSAEDKVYAYQQIARLDYYTGAIALPDPEDVEGTDQEKPNRKAKYAIFDKCMKDFKKVTSELKEINAKQELASRFLCFTFMAQNSNKLQKAIKLKDFKKIVGDVSATYTKDGEFYSELEGNILRYLASVRISDSGKPFQLFDAEEAKNIAERLFHPPSRYDRGYQAVLGPKDYFENYYTLADILRNEAVGETDRALSIVKKAVATLNKAEAMGKLTGGRAPENKRQRERLIRLCNEIKPDACK